MKKFPLPTLAVCFAGMIALFSGCSLFPRANSDPAKKYVLPALSGSSALDLGTGLSYTSRPYQLVIDMPAVYPPIDNTRIALKPQEQLIDYYADAEWANRLGILVQESLIYSFQNKGGVRGVSRPAEGIQGDYALKVEVRKFYIDQPDNQLTRTAKVDYMAHLVRLPGRHIVASNSFAYTHIVPEASLDDFVNSLSRAHLQASEAMIAWTVRLMPLSVK